MHGGEAFLSKLGAGRGFLEALLHALADFFHLTLVLKQGVGILDELLGDRLGLGVNIGEEVDEGLTKTSLVEFTLQQKGAGFAIGEPRGLGEVGGADIDAVAVPPNHFGVVKRAEKSPRKIAVG